MLWTNDGWYTKAINFTTNQWRSPNFWKGNSGRKAVVLHITDGVDSRSTLGNANTANPVSAHFLVREEGIYQHVSINDSSWANGIWETGHLWKGVPDSENPNRYTISIEREGVPFVPVSQRINDLTIQLLADLATQYPQFKPYVPHQNLIGHYEISPKNRANCPGPTLDFNAYASAANARQAPLQPPQAPLDGLPVPLRVIGVAPSITLATFTALLGDRQAPFDPRYFDVIAERVYTFAQWLDIDPAFVLAVWTHEQGMPLGSSELGKKSANPFNIRAYGRWPSVTYNGAEWNKYEDFQQGLFAAIQHLKSFYGATGKLAVEDIIPVFAPSSDGNTPAAYIAAVRSDMAAMRKREA